VKREKVRRRDTRRQDTINAECAQDLVGWVNDWVWTFDPRETTQGRAAYFPFKLWPIQAKYLRWLEARVAGRDEAVVEKSRDMGVSWLNVAFAVHRWLYHPGFKTTFGANKEDNVDHLGDPDALFEKQRLLLSYLPTWMLPTGFSRKQHDNFCRLINPHNGNVVSGEAGDNMGRGGRSSVYFIDEAAHVERAERADAATLASADCRIWCSSVNGMGNTFARKRFSGKIPVFTMHFRDDPRKDAQWERQMRDRTDEAIFAAEYDIDYSASVEGICIPAKWVEAARRIADLVPILAAPGGYGGLDVGGGKAKSVFIARKGPVVQMPVAWKDPDTIETAHRGLDAARAAGVEVLNYDSVGIGFGVTAALKRADTNGLKVAGVNVGLPPSNRVWPDGRRSHEKFGNLKAEIWHVARETFKRTYERVLWEEGQEGGIRHPIDECVSLPNHHDLAMQLSLVRRFRNEKGKMVMETKAQLAARGIASPDYAEGFVLTYVEPAERRRMIDLVGY
jgi:hypothetical protein